MNYFKFSEFDCNCKSCKSTGASGKVNMDADFLERLDFARSIAKGNQSFVITSGFRCEAHKNLQSAKEALTCMDMQQTLQPQIQLLDTGSHRLLLKLDLTGSEYQQREDLSMWTQIQTSLLESSSYIQTSTTGCTLKWASH